MPGTEDWLNFQNLIHIIHHINRRKERNYNHLDRGRKTFNEGQHTFKKNLSANQGFDQEYLQTKSTVSLTFSAGTQNAFPP